jgi:hypothetical protein
MERVRGIEPPWPAWKAGALPLSYTRSDKTVINITALSVNQMERATGFEPATLSLGS